MVLRLNAVPFVTVTEHRRSQTRFGRTRPDLEAGVRLRPVRVENAAGRVTFSEAQRGWKGNSSGHGKRSSRSGLHRSCGVQEGGAHQLHAGEQCGEVSEDGQEGLRRAGAAQPVVAEIPGKAVISEDKHMARPGQCRRDLQSKKDQAARRAVQDYVECSARRRHAGRHAFQYAWRPLRA